MTARAARFTIETYTKLERDAQLSRESKERMKRYRLRPNNRKLIRLLKFKETA
jgi:hypothetical protein